MAKIIRNGLLYGSSDSADIVYDNTTSGMTASTVQGAVDEVNTSIGDLSTLTTTEKSNLVGSVNELNGNLSNKADKTMLSNKNLLDNPFFTVNQREFSTNTSSNQYTVDRWKTNCFTSELTFSDGVFTNNNTTTVRRVISQPIENFSALLGKTVTLSAIAKVNSGEGFGLAYGTTDTNYFNIKKSSDILTNTDYKVVSWTFTVPTSLDRFYVVIYVRPTSNYSVKAVKLELGSVSTLANDTAPNYQEELIKCMTSTADASDTYANRVPNFAPNPNLLDNPWFTVNQRGQSSYNATGYTVDRWKNSNEKGSLTVNSDNTITLTKDATTGDYDVVQYIENSNLLVGKTYTLSIMLSDGTVLSNTGTIIDNSTQRRVITVPIDGFGTVFMTSVPANNRQNIAIRGSVANASITVKAVKLELGSVSTIANDVAPNYQQELAKCQRYFYKAKLLVVNGFLTANGQGYCMSINLPSCMAKEPTINLESYMVRTATGYSKHTSNSYVTPINLSVAYFNGNNITIRDTITATAVDTNNSVMVFTITDLELSADL